MNRAERRRNARLGLTDEDMNADHVAVERIHLKAAIEAMTSMADVLVEASGTAPEDVRQDLKKLQGEIGQLTGVLGLSLL